MRDTALSLRFRQAFIPAYANANVKKCSMEEKGLVYPCLVPILSRLKPSPRTPFPDFLEKTGCNQSNQTTVSYDTQ